MRCNINLSGLWHLLMLTEHLGIWDLGSIFYYQLKCLLLTEWCEQAIAGLYNMDVNSRIFLLLSLLHLFRGVLVGFGVGFSVSWFPVQFEDIIQISSVSWSAKELWVLGGEAVLSSRTELCSAEPSPPFPLANWNVCSSNPSGLCLAFTLTSFACQSWATPSAWCVFTRLSEILGKSCKVNTHQSKHFNCYLNFLNL